MRITFFFFSILFFSCSVKDKKTTSLEYIIFGTYCGECLGHCATMYRVDSTSIQIDTTDNFFGRPDEVFTFTGHRYETEIDSKDFFNKIDAELPDDFIEFKEKTYGDPDAYDQCGIYIELKSNGFVRKFYIDTNEKGVPDEINEYVAFLYKNIGKTE